MAHVPPGTFELNPNSSFFNSPVSHAVEIEKNYVSIVSDPNLYMKIQAHFYGHAHTDTFRFAVCPNRHLLFSFKLILNYIIHIIHF